MNEALEQAAEERRHAQKRRRLDFVYSNMALLENDPEAFGLFLLKFFPHKIREVEDWQVEPLRIMVEDPRGLILVPAGTMKTTIGSELYPIWRVCQCRNYERNGYFKHDHAAKESLNAVSVELQTNDRLIDAYGEFWPNSQTQRKFRYKWNEHQIDVVGRTRKSRSNNFNYRGYSGQALGSRCHLSHLDDVILEEMAMSPDQTKKFMNWLGSSFETQTYPLDSAPDWDLDEDGGTPFYDQLLIFGTCWNDQDGYSRIEMRNLDPEALDNPEFRPYSVCKVDLIKDEDTWETVSPRWPAARARAKKIEIGARAFNARYRNKPNDPETQVFRELWFDGGTDNRGVSYKGCWDDTISRTDDIPGSWMVAIGYDPQSGSTTRYAKKAAVVMLANEPSANGSWKPRLLDWWCGQTPIMDESDPESQLMVIISFADYVAKMGFMPTVVLEANQIQRGLKEPLESLAARQGVPLIVDLAYTGENKHDAHSGMEATAIDFQNGWLRIPSREVSDAEHYRGFVHEMVNYGTTKYSDVPMAYWFARRYLWDYRLRYVPNETVVSRRVPPWRQAYMNRRRSRRELKIINAHALRRPIEDIDYGE